LFRNSKVRGGGGGPGGFDIQMKSHPIFR